MFCSIVLSAPFLYAHKPQYHRLTLTGLLRNTKGHSKIIVVDWSLSTTTSAAERALLLPTEYSQNTVLQRRMPCSQGSYSQTLWPVLEIWLVIPHNYIIIAYLCNYAIRKHQARNACYGEGLPPPLKSNMGTQQTGHSKRPPILNILQNCDVLS